MNISEELVKIADRLWDEAKHWQEHPDYFIPNREAYAQAGKTYAEAMVEIGAFLAEKAHRQRGTHTDIVLWDLSRQLWHLAAKLKES